MAVAVQAYVFDRRCRLENRFHFLQQLLDQGGVSRLEVHGNEAAGHKVLCGLAAKGIDIESRSMLERTGRTDRMDTTEITAHDAKLLVIVEFRRATRLPRIE
jgi:hypothetical protein